MQTTPAFDKAAEISRSDTSGKARSTHASDTPACTAVLPTHLRTSTVRRPASATSPPRRLPCRSRHLGFSVGMGSTRSQPPGKPPMSLSVPVCSTCSLSRSVKNGWRKSAGDSTPGPLLASRMPLSQTSARVPVEPGTRHAGRRAAAMLQRRRSCTSLTPRNARAWRRAASSQALKQQSRAPALRYVSVLPHPLSGSSVTEVGARRRPSTPRDGAP